MTIDKAQGQDCDIVVISCVKHTADKGVLLKDVKRLNVAITRARKKLIVVGTDKYLKEIKPWDEIVQHMDSKHWSTEVQSIDDQLKSYLPRSAIASHLENV